MKKVFLFLFCAGALTLTAQKRTEFEASYESRKFNEFFLNNPVAQKIKFFYDHNNWKAASVYTSVDSLNKLSKHFNFNFIGDKFLFEELYGKIVFPEDEFKAVLKNKCADNFYSDITVTPDSIKIKFTGYCYPKPKKRRRDEIVFQKIEIHGGYKSGIKQLEKRVQSTFEENELLNNHKIKDSSLLYQIIIDSKDSCLKEVKLYYGQESEFSKFILNELIAACGWSPAIQGGRPVKAYRRIFVRLNSDRSITIVYPEE